MYEYDPSEGKGRCAVARDEWKSWPTWEDYEHEAERVRLRAIERYGSVPTSLVARFSNGTVERKISYASAADLPHKIRVKLKPAERNTNHPEWRYVTVLLKTVEVTV